MEYRYTGIILNKRDVGETDRIYTIFTLEGGKIRSLAKGVRKAHAKLASSLENITLADIIIVRARGLGKITGSIVENNFSLLKRDCDALMETFSGLNIFDKLVDWENPDQQIFALLKDYLEAVDFWSKDCVQEKQVLLRLAFLIKLLNALGYALEINHCVTCSKKLNENSLSFSSEAGGILCAECAKENGNSLLQLHPNVVKMMRLFLKNKMVALGKIKVTKDDCDRLSLLVNDFLNWTL
jgi:DNA repair protein RecO (recombination protein O)